MPARARVHGDRVRARRDRVGDPVLRAARRDPRDLAGADHEPARRRRAPVAVQRGGVLSVGRVGRPDELPAQPVHRRGRGRRRGDLPHDRVPGAARPLRLLRVLRGARRVRHAARERSSVRTADGTGPLAVEAGQRERFDRARLGADRLAPRRGSTLAPGETREVVFVLGYAENPPDAKFDPPGSGDDRTQALVRPVIDRYLRGDEVRGGARAGCAIAGRSSSTSLQVSTPNEHVDRMVNMWNPYQCMVTFNLSRSASSFESGIGRGMGFRDSSQDLLGFVQMVPERARERILDLAATQLADGRRVPPVPAAHEARQRRDRLRVQRRPAVARARRGRVREGDRRPARSSTSRSRTTTQPGTEAPLYEHLRRAVSYTLDRLGPHGLPLIGRADWNDCLNLNCLLRGAGRVVPDGPNREGGVAESVFIAGLFVLAAAELAALAELRGLPDDASATAAERAG